MASSSSSRLAQRGVLALLCLCLLPATSWGAWQFVGNVRTTTITPDTVDLTLDQGVVARVQMLAADLVRVRVNPSGTFSNRLSGAVAPTGLVAPHAATFETAEAVFLLSAQMTVVIIKTPFQVVLLRPDQRLLLADIAPQAIGWDTATGVIFTRKFAPQDEHYFGLGLRGGPLERRGRTFVLRNADEAGYGEFSDALYLSIPLYYGLRQGQAYGVFFDNPAWPFFDLDTDRQGIVTFGAFDGELDYYVMAGPTPAQVATTYARLTGLPSLPPQWALGYHQSRYGYRTQQEFLDLATTFRQLRIPCDALYLDLDYLEPGQIFSWDPQRFPTPLTFNASLETAGFKRVTIIDPVVQTQDRFWPLLAGAGYFLQRQDGTPVTNTIFLGDVSWLDFTKSAARAWYKTVLKFFLATGVTAVWNDLNEPAQNFMPEALYDFDGQKRTDLQARNLYALQETAATYQALRELRPTERPWVLSRAGYAGIQRYAANWSGDTLSTFDSLRVSVQISLSMGLSGQPHFGHDVGGFLGSPSPELFIRWLQFGSVTPFFRNHAINTSAPREPWRFGEPYTSIARQVIEQRYRLLPYLYTLVADAARTGAPVVAPTLWHFPSDPLTYTQDQELMLGPSMLVAPVLTAGATSRTVYLPAGSAWVDEATDRVYPGGQRVTVAAPLERLPIFVRQGSILPRGLVRQFVGEPVPAQVQADIYPGAATAFTLYEDDGKSMDYTTGKFLHTQLRTTVQPSSTTLTIQRLTGTWQPPARPWHLVFHHTPTLPTSVALNGVTLPRAATERDLASLPQGWWYGGSNQRLAVRLQDAAQPLTVTVRK